MIYYKCIFDKVSNWTQALPVTISWLWSSVYSQIVCKVCPQIFSECIQDTEIIF